MHTYIYIYIYTYTYISPVASHLAGEPVIDQAWLGPCDHAPHLGQPTSPLWWSRGAVLLRVVVALLLSYCSAGPWVAACGTTPLLTPFSFFRRVVAALSCVWFA